MKTKLLLTVFFTLSVGSIFAQPANDVCSGAIILTVNGACSTVDVTGATQTGSPSNCVYPVNSSYANDVWYKFVAPSTDLTICVTPNSNYDAIVGLFQNCGTFSQLACADDHNAFTGDGAGATEIIPSTSYAYTVGVLYYIRVYDPSGAAGGLITVCLTSPPSTPPNPTSNSPQCADMGVTLTRSGTPSSDETWYWQGTSCGTNTSNSGATYLATSSGTYYLRSRNNTCEDWSSGCGSIAVIVNPNPAVPTGGGNVTACTNTIPATLTAIPPSGSTVDWYNVSSGGSSLASNSNTYSTSTAGGYYAESRNTTTGCKGISRTLFTLTVNPVVTPSVSISANPSGAICAGTNVTFTANPVNGGAPSYQWKLNNNIVGSNPSYSNSSLVNGDQVSCIVTSTAICASPTTATSNTVNMVVNLIIVSANTTTAACGQSNGSATATASGSTPPYTYNWSNGQNTQTAIGLSANTYTVTVTDSTGCIASTTASVSNPGAPTVNVSSTPQSTATCNGTATINASGGIPPYTYSWSSNANNQTTSTATSLCGNITYTITVNDSINCLTMDTITVNKTVGINEQAESTALVIYPNPNKGQFTLSYESMGTEDLQIQVMNIMGEVVYSREYKKVSGRFLKEINLTNVASGVYSVQIKTGKKVHQQKLVKE